MIIPPPLIFLTNIIVLQMKQIQSLHKQQEETRHDLDKCNVSLFHICLS